MTQNVDTSRSDQVRWASGINIIAGLWLLISPFVLGFTDLQSAMRSDIIVGIVVAAIAAVRAGGMIDAPWLSWVNVVLGAWVLITPWVFGFVDRPLPLSSSLITGMVIVVLSAWNALASPAGVGSYRPG